MPGFQVRFDAERGCEVKGCSVCRVEKPVREFYKRPGGYHAPCKDCENAANKARYDANPEKYRGKSLEYARRNPEKTRARFARWESANKERRLAYYRQYNDEHREERRAYDRARHALETPEDRQRANAKMAARGYFRRWKAAHREEVRASDRRSHERHPEPGRLHMWRRAHALSAVPIEYRMCKADIIARDGAICYLCDESFTYDDLTIEHVIPLSRGGTHAPDNLRVACRPCNSSKGPKLLSEFLKP